MRACAAACVSVRARGRVYAAAGEQRCEVYVRARVLVHTHTPKIAHTGLARISQVLVSDRYAEALESSSHGKSQSYLQPKALLQALAEHGADILTLPYQETEALVAGRSFGEIWGVVDTPSELLLSDIHEMGTNGVYDSTNLPPVLLIGAGLQDPGPCVVLIC